MAVPASRWWTKLMGTVLDDGAAMAWDFLCAAT